MMISFRHKYFALTIFAMLFFAFFSILSAEPQSANFINYGFEKVLNTYQFKNAANYYQDTKFGAFTIKQNYLGTSMSSLSNYIREDESFSFGYKYAIDSNFSTSLLTNYILNSDSKSATNELQRINGIALAEYKLVQDVSLSAGYGIEDHKQSGNRNNGDILMLGTNINNIDLEGYLLNSIANYESLKLDNDRNNLDLFINSSMIKSYDDDNDLTMSINYKKQGRDYLNPALSSLEASQIESRMEDRISSALNLNFSLTDYLFAKLNFTFENIDISREYSRAIESNNYSYIKRSLNERNLGFAGETNYQSNIVNQKFGFSFLLRNDNNLVDNKFSLDDNELNRIIGYEKQRDNKNSISRLFSRSLFTISQNDSLEITLSIAMNRYDTPSEENNDDRDEQTSSFALQYFHRFSSVLAARIVADYSDNHLVFINAERSSLNNHNRILRLSPSFEYVYSGVTWKPRLELLANYTSYDFDQPGISTRSFSFRQISYSDSLIVRIDKDFSIDSRLFSRYFERGILYWNNFSETPQTSNLELFANLMLYFHYSEVSKIGLGARFYNLKQNNIASNQVQTSSNNFNQYSLGPEINIYYQLSGNSNVLVKGWFDFRTVNKIEQKVLGNLILQTNISL